MARKVSMKWSKFRDFRAQNPWISSEAFRRFFGWHLDRDVLRGFVQNHLAFIAHRPFDSLSLDEISFELTDVGTVYHVVFFHVEGQEEKSYRFHDLSIKSMIEHIKSRHETGKWSRHRVIFDRVVKETLRGDCRRGFSYEVYVFPPSFGFAGKE